MSKLIPDAAACRALWDTYHTPGNVRDHMNAVGAVSVFLANQLNASGESVDVELTEAGALLHDLLRLVGVVDIKLKHFKVAPSYEDLEYWRELNLRFAGKSHSEAATELLREEGYPEALCRVVAAHDFSSIVDPEIGPQTWPEKLVYYADKRVLHDSLVTLEYRLEDGLMRYPEFVNGPGAQLKRTAVFELEHEIFAPLRRDPDSLSPEELGLSPSLSD